MHPQRFVRVSAAVALLLTGAITPAAFAQANPDAASGKEVFIPERISRVPAGNDFNNPDSEFCFQRSKSTDNFVLFWAKEYGDDPMTNAVENRRFNVDEVLRESDRFYNYYVNTLKWVNQDKSLASKYKFLLFVIGGTSGTAFGGSIDNKIGAFWTPATRINRGPYGVVAHELGHSFQAILRADGAASFSGGSIGEMTSQYMLWQVYPEWMTFENYHLVAFMKATHLAFLHEDNQYHSCYPLEYWSGKHGPDFIGKMWREVQRGEDPVMTYKRLTGITQEQFNDEMFDAARRFVTWDLPRVEKVAARYANQHVTSLTRSSDGWYQIGISNCPQNYGYNAIKLKVPTAGTKVGLDFQGMVGAEGFSNVQPDKAGWRYGFLASKTDGARVYGDTFSRSAGTAEFIVPANTKYLWLVVSGAPTEHWIHPSRRRGGAGGPGGRGRPNTNTMASATGNTNVIGNANAITAGNSSAGAVAQWPYRFKLTGTAPDDSIVP
ncbi:MAG TPA: DUF6055 domain-containing protein [Verrucomicrobiae bacterium]|nr:DUF6055 domain-containing protein [Verrucomicrobiae bacterium]